MISWAAPLNSMANVLDALQQDPQVSKMMLGLAPAYDVMKNMPIDLLANMPHFESEVEGSTVGSSAKPNGSSGAAGIPAQQPANGPV